MAWGLAGMSTCNASTRGCGMHACTSARRRCCPSSAGRQQLMEPLVNYGVKCMSMGFFMKV
jgi:hypothetical protein